MRPVCRRSFPHNIRPRRIVPWFCAALFIALGGCASAPRIADQAVEANLAVEQAHNRILLLNVVRAFHDRPLYFTSLEQLFGPLGKGHVQGGLSLPFGPDGWGGSTLNLDLQPDTPSFNVAVHDSRAFMRGFLSPVSPAILGYYLRQRWPADLLLNLFVNEVVIVDETGHVHQRYRNHPQDPASLQEFQQLVGALRSCELRVSMDLDKQAYGPEVRVSNLSQLISARNAKLHLERVEEGGDAYQPYTVSSRTVLEIRSALGASCPGIPNGLGGAIKTATFYYDKNAAARLLWKQGHEAAEGAPHRYAVLTLRSPEAMIYFLGQLARASHEAALGERHAAPASNLQAPRGTAAHEQPLFVLQQTAAGSFPEDTGFQVEYEGRIYSVPSKAGRTMSVLSLISQVIGLQKEANELPGVGTFRVIP